MSWPWGALKAAVTACSLVVELHPAQVAATGQLLVSRSSSAGGAKASSGMSSKSSSGPRRCQPAGRIRAGTPLSWRGCSAVFGGSGMAAAQLVSAAAAEAGSFGHGPLLHGFRCPTRYRLVVSTTSRYTGSVMPRRTDSEGSRARLAQHDTAIPRRRPVLSGSGATVVPDVTTRVNTVFSCPPQQRPAARQNTRDIDMEQFWLPRAPGAGWVGSPRCRRAAPGTARCRAVGGFCCGLLGSRRETLRSYRGLRSTGPAQSLAVAFCISCTTFEVRHRVCPAQRLRWWSCGCWWGGRRDAHRTAFGALPAAQVATEGGIPCRGASVAYPG